MKLRNEVKAGGFVLISLMLVGALILIMGRERQIFAKQSKFYAFFKDVKGLSAGAPVRMGGIPVGRVDKVGFSDNPQDPQVRVTILVNEDYLDRIRRDSMVLIDTQGLLGDRFVSLSSGVDTTRISPGSQLPSQEIADLQQVMQRANSAVSNTSQITERINQALEGLSAETFQNIASASQNIAEIFKAIKSEEGFIHRLIYSETEGKKLITSLTDSSKDISDLSREIRNGKGILHALVYSNGGDRAVQRLFDASDSVASASDNLSALLLQAKNGKGLLHDLIYTDIEPGVVAKRIEQVLVSLATMATNLKTASDSLVQGTGTLGALLVDPKLYDNLVEVTDGAKRSFILRQAIRSSLRQGSWISP
jgi:phospholipid/cholesterol/gamma-HCH transport system substrate-binding protein